MNLKGRNALVTGSSRGIGKGCILEMARAAVVLLMLVASMDVSFYYPKGPIEAPGTVQLAFAVLAFALVGLFFLTIVSAVRFTGQANELERRLKEGGADI